MNIVGVESLIYGSEDLDAAKRFYTDWGLDLVSDTAAGADFALADGTTVLIRGVDDPSLPPAAVPGSTVRECIWGVDNQATLDAIGADLAKDRAVEADQTGTLHTIDDLGYRIGFRVTSRNEIGLGLPDTNTVGTTTRRNARADAVSERKIRQLRFSHVVYWVPGDPAKYCRFYMDRLGFKLTEGIKDKAMFMRCSLAHDHHNLFLQRGGQNFGFQHVAYELRDMDDMMMIGTHMEAQGWQSHLGPGRHILGSNTYWYFWCAAGGVVETGSDMDYITDDWPSKIYDEFPGGSSWRVRPADEGLAPGHGTWPTTADALSPVPAD
jgi:catechol 2,3-dioxygenase-like lactoylglutathione lyase family enzyme